MSSTMMYPLMNLGSGFVTPLSAAPFSAIVETYDTPVPTREDEYRAIEAQLKNASEKASGMETFPMAHVLEKSFAAPCKKCLSFVCNCQ